MKQSKPSRVGCGLTPFAVALIATLLIGASTDQGPRVSLAVGPVEIGSGEPPDWRQAHGGELLAPGDAVRTGHGGRAELQLNSGTVRLYENSLLRLPDSAFKNSQPNSVDLDEGTSIFDVLKRKKGDEFKVRTPQAVVMVKGTRFMVDLNAGFAVSVFEGLVGVGDLAEESQRSVAVGKAAMGTPENLVIEQHDIPDPWESWSSGEAAPTPQIGESSDQGNGMPEHARSALQEVTNAAVVAHAGHNPAQSSVPGPAALEGADLATRAEELSQAIAPEIVNDGLSNAAGGGTGVGNVSWQTFSTSVSGDERLRFTISGATYSLQRGEVDSLNSGGEINWTGVTNGTTLQGLLQSNGFAVPSDLVKAIDGN